MTDRPNNILYFALLLALTICALTPAATHAVPLVQRDLMVTLVDGLDLSFGLPDEPQDPDYINLLTGSRNFRFEAEDVYTPEEDEVSRMSFRNFGDFSGSAWLQGLTRSTSLQLRFILPLEGRYRLFASVRKGEHSLEVGGATFTLSGEDRFTRIELGEVELLAGPQEVLVTLAPGGAIDYIELTGSALAPISPRLGWQPDETLVWDDIRTTLLQAFGISELLPESASRIQIEAEQLPLNSDQDLSAVSVPHLGRPSKGMWLRAGRLPVRLDIPLELAEGGFYRTTLRVMGSPIELTVDQHLTITLDANPYLEDLRLDPLFFYPGTNQLSLLLPPGAGFDQLRLVHLESDPDLISNLLGLQTSGRSPQAADLDRITTLLAAFGTDR